MARDILSGRQGLRDALMSSAYTEAAELELKPARERWSAMSDIEREAMAVEGEYQLAEHQRILDEERRERLKGKRAWTSGRRSPAAQEDN